MFSGKLLVNSYLQFLFFGQAIGKFSTGRVPRSVHCWQAIGRLHTTRKIVLTPWFIAVNTNCLLGIALPQKTFLQRFYKPKKPFEKFLRAPMEDQGTKDGAVTGSKADQKKDSTEGPLSETEVCSDFGFIEPALKCLHTAYKFCNRTQYPCTGILLRQATGFDGHPAASNSAMPCPGARPALADRAPPSMPEIATGLAPKGTVHCAYMISAVTVGAKCNSC